MKPLWFFIFETILIYFKITCKLWKINEMISKISSRYDIIWLYLTSSLIQNLCKIKVNKKHIEEVSRYRMPSYTISYSKNIQRDASWWNIIHSWPHMMQFRLIIHSSHDHYQAFQNKKSTLGSSEEYRVTWSALDSLDQGAKVMTKAPISGSRLLGAWFAYWFVSWSLGLIRHKYY